MVDQGRLRVRPWLVRLGLLLLVALSLGGTPQAEAQTTGICGRTAEVQEWILSRVTSTACADVTATELAGISGTIEITDYSSETLLSSDFEGLTGAFTEISITESLTLRTVPAGAFSEIDTSGVTTLRLQKTGVRVIEEGAFSGFTGLTKLYMRQNTLTLLSADLFADLGSLQVLWLESNNLKALPATLFTPFASTLEELDLGRNALASLDASTFSALTNLTTLRVDRNDLTSLPAGLLTGLTSLRIVDLAGNDLTTLPSGLFTGLTGLASVNLGETRLTSLDAGTFTGLTGLDTLFLHDTALTTLPAGLFTGLNSLKYLYLNGNGITALDEDIFDGLTSLSTLYLNDNESLTALDEDIFDGLTSLSTLYLNDNESLTALDEDIFDGLNSLNYLYLNGNGITALDEDIFDGLTSLWWLFLHGNSLTTLPTDLFDGLNLVVLSLLDNDIETLDAEIFDGLTFLSYLWLHYNSLSTLPENVFTGLDLIQLYLGNNSLTTLPTDLFDPLDDSLTHLYLDGNGLTDLQADIFDGLEGLQVLDLACNSLTALDLGATSPFNPFATSLVYLDVGANSFTTAPTETAVRAKLTNPDLALYLTGTPPCRSPGDTGMSSLTVSEGTLDPAFVAPGLRSYEVTVGHDVDSITVIPTLRSDRASIVVPDVGGFGDGTLADSNTLYYGRNDIRWKVQPAVGALTSWYRVYVSREHPPVIFAHLESLALSGLTLSPEFDPDITSYTTTAPAGQTETTVTATPLDPDATAVVKLNGTEDPDGTVSLATGSNTITIEVTAKDGMTVQAYTVTVRRGSVRFGAPSYTAVEGGLGATVQVELDPAPTSPVTIELAASPRGGATASDYSGIPPSLTFGVGETVKTFVVTAIDDEDDDDGESVRISFANLPEGLEAGDPSDTLVLLEDDDFVGSVAFERDSYTAPEGGPAATIVVRLGEPAPAATEFSLTVTHLGGATSADYDLSHQTVAFDAGQQTQTITVTAIDDRENDDFESIQLSFAAPPQGYIAGQPTTVLLTDNDIAMPIVTIESASATEGEDIVFTLRISPPADPDRWVALHYGVGDLTATSGVNARDYGPYGPTHLVQIGFGVSSAEIRIPTIDDDRDEPDETFRIRLLEGSRYLLGTPHEAIGTIIDNDDSSPVDTVPGDTSTNATVSATGGPFTGAVTGNIEHLYDEDWYRVSFEKGKCYLIEVRGSQDHEGATPNGHTLTLSDPFLEGIYDASGTYIPGTQIDDGGIGNDSSIILGFSESGTYYISVSHGWFDQGGTYEVDVTPMNKSNIHCKRV